MRNKELRDSYQKLILEYYEFDAKERKCILDVINRLEEVKGKEKTDSDLAEKCKSVYQILKGKEPFQEFLRLLKEEKKMGDFCNTTYK